MNAAAPMASAAQMVFLTAIGSDTPMSSRWAGGYIFGTEVFIKSRPPQSGGGDFTLGAIVQPDSLQPLAAGAGVITGSGGIAGAGEFRIRRYGRISRAR